jgi:F420-dependent oxidoreductase-like protein
MKIGIIVPQGWTQEYAGWPPERAWARTRGLALEAERLGFESIWLFDHFQTMPQATDELTFEAFTSLSALAALTSRVRLGHLVLCSGYRNPALVAKMAGTLDVISDGRLEVGIGAGWKQDEWLAYGYGFPPLRERLARLGETLEVLDRMLRPGHATFEGHLASVTDAINLPKGVQQPRIPIIVGGNGRNVTWRLAARHADELNLDWVSPEDTRDALPIIASRCEEVRRDPATLRVSIHMNWHEADRAGARRQEVLGAYRELGIARVMVLLRGAAADDGALESLAEDARAIGVSLD